jgi:hypothetical protein
MSPALAFRQAVGVFRCLGAHWALRWGNAGRKAFPGPFCLLVAACASLASRPCYFRVVHSTNYFDAFIAIASDSDAVRGTVPRETANPSVALRTFQMIHGRPYQNTSDDVIFTVYADRNGIPTAERAAARKDFFSKGQACLRASDLGKKHGWGIHSDAEGRVALYGVETEEYKELVSGERLGSNGKPVTVKRAMRSRR